VRIGRVAGRPALPRLDLAAQQQRTMSRCRRSIVSGVTSGSRLRPARLLSLQDGELMAQDQNFRGLPRLLAPGQPQPRGDPSDQEEHEPQAHDR
jgi:hypothetical protein